MGQEIANLKTFCQSYWAIPLVLISGELADLLVTIYGLGNYATETNPLVQDLEGITSPLLLILKFGLPLLGLLATAALWPRTARTIWGAIGLTCWMVAGWNLYIAFYPRTSSLSDFWFYCTTLLICWTIAVVVLEGGTIVWKRLTG